MEHIVANDVLAQRDGCPGPGFLQPLANPPVTVPTASRLSTLTVKFLVVQSMNTFSCSSVISRLQLSQEFWKMRLRSFIQTLIETSSEF